jgi:hypothetical protein
LEEVLGGRRRTSARVVLHLPSPVAGCLSRRNAISESKHFFRRSKRTFEAIPTLSRHSKKLKSEELQSGCAPCPARFTVGRRVSVQSGGPEHRAASLPSIPATVMESKGRCGPQSVRESVHLKCGHRDHQTTGVSRFTMIRSRPARSKSEWPTKQSIASFQTAIEEWVHNVSSLALLTRARRSRLCGPLSASVLHHPARFSPTFPYLSCLPPALSSSSIRSPHDRPSLLGFTTLVEEWVRTTSSPTTLGLPNSRPLTTFHNSAHSPSGVQTISSPPSPSGSTRIEEWVAMTSSGRQPGHKPTISQSGCGTARAPLGRHCRVGVCQCRRLGHNRRVGAQQSARLCAKIHAIAEWVRPFLTFSKSL